MTEPRPTEPSLLSPPSSLSFSHSHSLLHTHTQTHIFTHSLVNQYLFHYFYISWKQISLSLTPSLLFLLPFLPSSPSLFPRYAISSPLPRPVFNMALKPQPHAKCLHAPGIRHAPHDRAHRIAQPQCPYNLKPQIWGRSWTSRLCKTYRCFVCLRLL